MGACSNCGLVYSWNGPCPKCNTASAELSRLRSEVERLECARTDLVDELARLRSELEKLRAENEVLRRDRCIPELCPQALACIDARDPQPGELARLRAVEDLARRASYGKSLAEISTLLMELRPLLAALQPKEVSDE